MFDRQGRPCRTSTVLTYDVRGYFLDADVRVCERTIEDVTAGRHALPEGYRLFFVDGRAYWGSVHALIRAKPNVAYDFAHYGDTQLRALTASRPGESWETTQTALPFVPFSTASALGQGRTYYAFGALRFLSPRADSLPLDENSAVVGLDGFWLGDPGALAHLLQRPLEPYVEVWYVQLTEQPEQTIRRAFLPTYPKASVAAEWAALTSQTEVGRRDKNGDLLLKAVAFVIVAKFAHGVAQALGELPGSQRSAGQPYPDGGGGAVPPPDEEHDDEPAPTEGLHGDCHFGALGGC